MSSNNKNVRPFDRAGKICFSEFLNLYQANMYYFIFLTPLTPSQHFLKSLYYDMVFGSLGTTIYKDVPIPHIINTLTKN